VSAFVNRTRWHRGLTRLGKKNSLRNAESNTFLHRPSILSLTVEVVAQLGRPQSPSKARTLQPAIGTMANISTMRRRMLRKLLVPSSETLLSQFLDSRPASVVDPASARVLLGLAESPQGPHTLAGILFGCAQIRDELCLGGAFRWMA